jgi:cardiolipin synthase (CMP-forming)
LFRNLPNVLTAFRILLVPLIGRSLLQRHFREALGLILIAGLTDAVDGWLARRFRWTSRLGAWLDPMADKALLITVYISLGLIGLIPLWLTALVLGRDAFILGMVAIGLAFTRVRDFPPSFSGKVSTVIQVCAALAILVNAAAGSPLPFFLTGTVFAVTAAATAASGFDYGRRGLLTLRQLRN